jgi:hypothetical protein
MENEQNDQHRKQQQEQLQNLWKRHHDQIRRLASEDPSLMVYDSDRIVAILASRLSDYDGQIEDAEFLAWAAEIIKLTIARFAFFYAIHKKYRRSILAGIWPILHKNWDLRDHRDTRFIARQIEADTLWWIWQHLDDLMIPGTAKLSTRLQARGKIDAMTWRKTRLRENARFDYDFDVDGFGTCNFDVDEAETPLYFDPFTSEEGDEPTRRPKSHEIPSPSDWELAMKSGVPRLLCRSCKSLKSISPHSTRGNSAVELECGHERPACLQVSAERFPALNK